MQIPRVLSVAGSDPSGGAGIQADLKTFHAFGCYGMSVLTALTAQNTMGVSAVQTLPPEFVQAQLDAVFADCRPACLKIGMLADRATVEAVHSVLARFPEVPYVLDPVIVATSGDRLLDPDAERAVVDLLASHARLVTPNAAEALALTGVQVRDTESAVEAARHLLDQGARAVLVKGGDSGRTVAVDVLVRQDSDVPLVFTRPRVDVAASHGTGCTLSAAITALLARDQLLPDAVERAKEFVYRGLVDSFPVGRGAVPVNHLVRPPPERS